MRTWGAGVALAVVLVACGTGVREVRNVGGEPVYEAKCKGSAADCIVDARDKCRAGYELLDSESHAGGVAADVMPGPVTWYSMTFKCSSSGGAERPAFAWRGQTYQPAPVSQRPPPAPMSTFEPYGLSDTPTPSLATPAPPPGCRSDLECGVGNLCAKPQGSFEGTCARAVNRYGTPTYTPPRSNSLGPGGEGQCAFDTECPIGFHCIKGTSLRGNCMK